jgi:Flp pilus assembly protein CpaB
VSWHRRKLAVLAALAAVLTGLAATTSDGPPTLTVVRASGELAGGTLLDASDLELTSVLVRDAPEGAVGTIEDLVGQRLAAPVAEGQVLTPLALVAAGADVTRGRVVAPLRLADADLVALLRAGDLVDVIAAGDQSAEAVSNSGETPAEPLGARVVAQAVRVVTVPEPMDDAEAVSGALVLLEVMPETARALAQAAAEASLTVIWR